VKLHRQRSPRPSVLVGSTDPSAPSWRQQSADQLIEAMLDARQSRPGIVQQSELTVRLIRALEAMAEESSETGARLIFVTWVLVVLTVVLVALTIVLARQ
jgi:hypothetical protein